ncbi:MAG: sterol-binding protein, partial [Bacteroidota bacterium]
MDLATTTEKVQYLAGKADEPIGSSVKFDLGEAVVFLDGTGNSNTVHNKDEAADCTVRMSHE